MSIKELSFDNNNESVATDISDDESSHMSIDEKNGEWTNKDLLSINLPITCYLPQKIVIILRSINKILNENNKAGVEFGIYIQGSFKNGVLMINPNNFYIPEQKVTSASIDFKESIPSNDYNGVIHKHPTGCKKFSGTDNKYINQNFEFSLLYESENIVDGIFNATINNTVRVQLPIKTEILYPIYNLDNIDSILNKINVYTPPKYNINMRPLHDTNQFGILPFLDRDDILDANGNSSELDDSDIEESEDIDADIIDTNIYQCKHCYEPQEIVEEDFPHICESCGSILMSEDDVLDIDLNDINGYDPDVRNKIMQILRGD